MIIPSMRSIRRQCSLNILFTEYKFDLACPYSGWWGVLADDQRNRQLDRLVGHNIVDLK
jgi:hypothetical protein